MLPLLLLLLPMALIAAACRFGRILPTTITTASVAKKKQSHKPVSKPYRLTCWRCARESARRCGVRRAADACPMEEGVQGGEVWGMWRMHGHDAAAASHVAVLVD
jgi:hypothetical protein